MMRRVGLRFQFNVHFSRLGLLFFVCLASNSASGNSVRPTFHDDSDHSRHLQTIETSRLCKVSINIECFLANGSGEAGTTSCADMTPVLPPSQCGSLDIVLKYTYCNLMDQFKLDFLEDKTVFKALGQTLNGVNTDSMIPKCRIYHSLHTIDTCTRSVIGASARIEGWIDGQQSNGLDYYCNEGVFFQQQIPTREATSNPTASPTWSPTKHPSKAPTRAPMKQPSKNPTASPTWSPTKQPSRAPSKAPIKQPTPNPFASPTRSPTKQPSRAPSKAPIKQPTPNPSASPTRSPTKQPSRAPLPGTITYSPTQSPTQSPTSVTLTNANQPTNSPSKASNVNTNAAIKTKTLNNQSSLYIGLSAGGFALVAILATLITKRRNTRKKALLDENHNLLHARFADSTSPTKTIDSMAGPFSSASTSKSKTPSHRSIMKKNTNISTKSLESNRSFSKRDFYQEQDKSLSKRIESIYDNDDHLSFESDDFDIIQMDKDVDGHRHEDDLDSDSSGDSSDAFDDVGSGSGFESDTFGSLEFDNNTFESVGCVKGCGGLPESFSMKVGRIKSNMDQAAKDKWFKIKSEELDSTVDM